MYSNDPLATQNSMGMGFSQDDYGGGPDLQLPESIDVPTFSDGYGDGMQSGEPLSEPVSWQHGTQAVSQSQTQGMSLGATQYAEVGQPPMAEVDPLDADRFLPGACHSSTSVCRSRRRLCRSTWGDNSQSARGPTIGHFH